MTNAQVNYFPNMTISMYNEVLSVAAQICMCLFVNSLE
jgi:hypothetical protein